MIHSDPLRSICSPLNPDKLWSISNVFKTSWQFRIVTKKKKKKISVPVLYVTLALIVSREPSVVHCAIPPNPYVTPDLHRIFLVLLPLPHSPYHTHLVTASTIVPLRATRH